MNGKIRECIQQILCFVFPSLDGNLNDEWGPNEIEEWDSMGHLNLIMAISEKFNITFEFEEVMTIEKVGDIFLVLEKKGVK